MPTLQFKGKSFVQNHHLAVKFHQLMGVKGKSPTDKVSLHDNLIVQGDNLKALKALLPTYAGKVKCIYIDPPYNTGTENWVYNDNVNSPMMQEWLADNTPVDKDDLCRHDKWLCMMMPRLKLLKELLSEDGILLFSIDDNEVHAARYLLNEIFGEDNYLNTIHWKARGTGGQVKDGAIASQFQYIILHAKNKAQSKLNKFENESAGLDNWRDYRKSGGLWQKKHRLNQHFPFYYSEKHDLLSLERTGKSDEVVILPKAQNGVEGYWENYPATAKDRLLAKELKVKRDRKGEWKIIQYEVGQDDVNVGNYIDLPSTRAMSEMKDLGIDFETPKPVELIEHVLSLASDDDDIILDSFAGSGTTAHAVLNLNKAGSKRRFILVEMEDYADSITAERVRRVIKGVPKSKNFQEGTGGSFSYFKLGPPIEMEHILHGDRLPSYEELARYVYYTATGEEFNAEDISKDPKKPFIGTSKNYPGGVYLFYEGKMDYLMNRAFTLDMARALGKHNNKRRLVFAPMKYLDQDYLDEMRIDYSQLPFEIYKFKE
ncbi:MAG: site-specific DNA-methyltransferase [Flavobacteriales bacterium]|nr:site-specific DNA-methyltransferase [Flavobacteriales bacterium]